MKRAWILAALCCCCLGVVAEEQGAAPVSIPNVGNARVKVFAQNLQNYYYNYNTGRGNYTPEEFREKTRKMVDAMMWIGADIYALCEVEAQPIVLKQLADSMNTRVEGEPFVAVSNDLNDEWDSYYNNNLKSGFIYNKNTVRPIGESYAGTPGSAYYSRTMRIQTFEEIATGQRFTLSMNHFKAKDNSEDQGENKRKENATNLVTQLPIYAQDPDILIMGDLNCEVGEAPLEIIENAGYVEQLLRFNANTNPYSHCYNGGELIDHVYANASMAEQITGAGIFHISTSCGASAYSNYNYRYSDHDPYVVGLNLEKLNICEEREYNYLTSGLGDCTVDNSTIWTWDSYRYAKATAYQLGLTPSEAHLFTPALDLTDFKAVTLSFTHAHRFCGTPSEELTLWVTDDFKGSYEASTWKQLTINPYTDNNSWTWLDATVNVPITYVGSNTVFAFKYKWTAYKTGTWEIKNLKIEGGCTAVPTGIEDIRPEQRGQKTIENGQLLITLPDGSSYNGFGIRIR